MADYIFNVKGLTANDRQQWEKDNVEELRKRGYENFSEERKDRLFRNKMFQNKFGGREDYDKLINMSPEARDSLYLGSPDANVEDTVQYKDAVSSIESEFQRAKTVTNDFMGNSGRKWKEFDMMLDELSPYYRRYKNTNYFPLDADKKISLMSKFAVDSQAFGVDVALQKMAEDIKTEVSHNQPLIDKLANGFVGMGAMISGSTISFIGGAAGFLESATGFDRLFGSNADPNYFRNIWKQMSENPLTRYGNKVMETKSWWISDDPEMNYDHHEIIRTAEEDKNLWSNIFSINTIPELIEQGGFTMASMVEGAALAKLGNMAFNTMRYAKAADKLAASAEDLKRMRDAYQRYARMEMAYNRYWVPGMVGSGESLIEGGQTKQTTLESLLDMIDREYNEKVESEVQRRMSGLAVPQGIGLFGESGTAMTDEEYRQREEIRIRKEVAEEFRPMYDDAVRRAGLNADTAGMMNFAINSFINGGLNMTLKAGIFDSRIGEAIKRGKIGKLFAGERFTINDMGEAVANRIGKGRSLWNMAKESLGEGIEEDIQTTSNAFSQAGAEADMTNYLAQRFNGVADDAIVDSLGHNLGAAFIAAGKTAVSKDAIQSGIYGSLGQMLGTFNVNAAFSKGNRVSLEGKEGFEKAGAIARNIWRNPIVESVLSDRQENKLREEAAAAMNEWLSQGNNRDRITSLRGSLGWAREAQLAMENGDEFSYRNSQLGKLVQDYFMLEQLKGTPMYDAFIQRYMDIVNAKPGDAMAMEIQKYDSRPLEIVQRDAQAMLDIMGKVQEATADIESTLGDSVPQEVKEALIYGKLSIADWDERADRIEGTLKGYSDRVGDISDEDNGLTREQKVYLARNGSFAKPDRYDSTIDRIREEIEILEKNSRVLSKKQAKVLNRKRKTLKRLERERKKLVSEHERLSKGVGLNPILTFKDIMGLNPADRYVMLNPANRDNYSEDQRMVIESLIQNYTLYDSRFMNLIEDAARIDEARHTFLEQYNDALASPRLLEAVNRRLEAGRRYDELSKSYSRIGDITNYEEFVNAVDDAYAKGDSFDNAVLAQTLKDNDMFKRYRRDRNTVEGIYEQLVKNDLFKDMSEDDLDLVAAMTEFLVRKGVDVGDYDAAVAALTAADKDGKSVLASYIEAMNQRLENSGHKNLRISMDNIGTVVNTYKEALRSYKSNERTKAEVTREPESKSVTDSKPVSPGNVFESKAAANTLEEAAESQRRESEASKPENDNPPVSPGAKPVVIPQNYADNNDGRVLYGVESAYDSVENASPIYDEESRNEARKVLDSLGDRKYKSEDEFLEAVNKEADRLLGQTKSGGDTNERAGSLLRQAARSIEKVIEGREDRKDKNPARADAGTVQATARSGNSMLLANIDENKNGFLSRKFKEWGVAKFLASGKLKSGRKAKKVRYLVLDDVTQGVMDDMGSQKGVVYSAERDLPVLVVVEDSGGPLLIGRTRYQPIGCLQNSSRSVVAGEVRRLAMKTKSGKFVSQGNRMLTSSVLVHSPANKVSKSMDDDVDINTLIYNDMTPEELAVMNDPAVNGFEKEIIYTRHVMKFTDRLRVGKDKQGKITLYYDQPSLKGDGSVNSTPVLTRGLDESFNKEGVSLVDVLVSGDSNAIINFNSRTRDFVRRLGDILKAGLSELTTDGNEFTGESDAKSRIDRINSTLRRYIYSSMGEFSVRPAVVDGNLALDLYMGEERLGRIADSVNDKEMTDEHKAEILANLFMKGGKLRQGVNWQVDKDPEHYDKSGKYYDAESVSSMVYDNVVRLGIQSLDRKISDVEVSNPVRDSTPIPRPSQTVVNPDNATSGDSGDHGRAVTSSGEIVDTDTGLTDDGRKPVNNVPTPKDKAAETVSRIHSDSKGIRLTSDEKNYVDESTGRMYARVTSVIQSTEDGEAFDEDSAWVTPSTNIGTGIDTLVRDFFAGSLKEWSDYPNISERAFNAFVSKLEGLRDYFEANGLTAVPNDVTVTGSLHITDDKGVTRELPVAGTLDILAYDNEGNFYIFDMKTYRSRIDEKKLDKYRKQLSLYKKFLEEKYGIKVKSLNIIPIKVDYPAPNKRNVYSVSDGNQLLLNGNEFKELKPILDDVRKVDETGVDIVYDKLTDSERRLIDSVIPEEGRVEDAEPVSDPPSPPNSELRTGPVRTKRRKNAPKKDSKPVSNEGDPTGLRFNDLTSEQQDMLRAKYSEMPDVEDFFNGMSEDLKKQEVGCLQI